ncbi:MAG: NADH dehydrogenase (quinone) subunit D [Planctomycetaceae bacterium]|nr:NADH dehydrogenase (quinone) subunit D [Planctomycetaceae bacterium]
MAGTTTAPKKPIDADVETITVNFGPQHPATHGTLRIELDLDGERIVGARPEIGYLHTGFEKIAEEMSYNQFVTVTDRMNYFSPLCNNFGFVHAVEEMCGIEITPRCKYARVLLCELSRVADHILSVGLGAMDLGAFSVMLWGFVERERLYDIFEHATGARLTTSHARVGGIARDIPDDLIPRIKKFIDDFPATLDKTEKMLSRNRIWWGRTVGVGALTTEQCLSYGVTGPLARASGVDYDLRRDRPYWAYPELDFNVITRTDGDIYARYKVRLDEMRESIKLIRQCLEKMPKGPINIEDHKVTIPSKKDVYTKMESLIMHFKHYMDDHGMDTPRRSEVYSCTESPNGELGWYIISQGRSQPYRVRCRPPCLLTYGAYPEMIKNALISDAVAALSSINVIAGELDR